MKEKKNIERLFQEKFKDFEAIPPQDSWDIIASKLNKKKKKRVIPFWFKLSGIAASFVILGTLIWNYTTDKNEIIPNNTIVLENSTIENNPNQKPNNSIISSTNKNELKLNSSNNTKNEEGNQNDKINFSTINKNENNFVFHTKENKKATKTISTLENSENIKVKKSASESNSIVSNDENNFLKNAASEKNSLVANTEINKEALKNSISEMNSIVSNEEKSDANPKNKSTKIFDLENITSKEATVLNENKESKSTSTNNNISDFNENTISKTIGTSTEIMKNDSTLVAKIAEEKNPLEELLLANEEGKNEAEKEEKRNKWAISSVAAPVYFNSMTQGSAIDEQFENNSKSYATTLSYGIGGSYSVSKKLSIRTGINNINFSYNTNDVAYQTNFSAKAIGNIPAISRNNNGSNIVFSSKNNAQIALSGDVENVSISNSGAIKQDFSYIEIPLELSYKLLDKKFGIEVIGGMSTLFLNKNSVFLVTNGMEMNVGKANNLNNIHFSSNVGLGFRYRILKNFTANLQPMFKYQINSFSENASNFKPYFIGLYSGISFSF
jgi:hypothetical protein